VVCQRSGLLEEWPVGEVVYLAEHPTHFFLSTRYRFAIYHKRGLIIAYAELPVNPTQAALQVFYRAADLHTPDAYLADLPLIVPKIF
jgi:hypothetical protein